MNNTEEIVSLISFLKMDALHQKVEEALNTIRPYLEADGGNVSVVEITSDQILRLELTGACKTCSMSHMTIGQELKKPLNALFLK